MSQNREREGWGLSSEHEEDKVQEVDPRSVDLDRLMAEKAKDPTATWSGDEDAEHRSGHASGEGAS
jgi:hypothetical protein